jgi:hypothetical protein
MLPADIFNCPFNATRSERDAALRAVRLADPGVQEAQVVMDLGDCANGGAWVLTGGLLVDGDGGGESVDAVHIWFLDLA